MYEVLMVTPFGFVFELSGTCSYFSEYGFFDVYINGEFYTSSDINVVTLLSLEPNTYYEVEVVDCNEVVVSFGVMTLRPNYLVNVKDFNAAGDGVSNDTAAVNAAIYTTPVGSTVVFPKGEYLVDQILLRSGVDLYLAKGAKIIRNNDKQAAIIKGYLRSFDGLDTDVNTTWEGNPLDCHTALVYGKNIRDVHIYGEGVFDGNGSGLWDSKHEKDRSSKNILIVDSVNIEISGVSSINSVSWSIHALKCENINLRALFIHSKDKSRLSDGIVTESCHSMEIIGCQINVGNDCISIKSGKYYMSMHHRRPTRSVTIKNCMLENGQSAVTVGSEISCGVFGAEVKLCLFENTRHGLHIKTRRGRGELAVVDGISLKNVKMEGVRHCIAVNMFYNTERHGKSEYVTNRKSGKKDDFTPTVRNIWLNNIHAKNIGGSAIFIYGLPENPVGQILIMDSYFRFAGPDSRIHECPSEMSDFEVIENLGFFFENADEVILSNNKAAGNCVNHANIVVMEWSDGEPHSCGGGLEAGIKFNATAL